ncbi:hypothetical protein [Parageobacillus thermoglucosidasius]|uniref:hypothetical protein n=1 Tax=Parageobacillus thermoglucosidasius TaxID=1426 RepID=UPI001FCC7496|nr:hypothetical protein [Parageobacillus thermoglucosidasius]BDG34011.1 hypothetical protein PthBH41_37230 [Parageobacillus thermoglucosidasius]
MAFVVACEKEYQKHQTFSSVDEMNRHIAEMKKRVHFTPAELRILDVMVKHSCKVIGACWLKKANIMKLANVESEITLRRFFKKMQNYGFMKIYRTYRKKKGGQSSNIYEFQKVFSENCLGGLSRRENAENEGAPTGKEAKTKTETIISEAKRNNNNNNINNIRTANVSNNTSSVPVDKLDASYTSSKVPTAFRDLVKCFYDDAQTIEEFWKIITIQTRKLSYYSLDDRMALAVNSFRQMVRNIKRGRKVRNIFGYFWGIVNKKIELEYRNIMIKLELGLDADSEDIIFYIA